MPVITPCKPRICSTHTITKSTLAVLRAEFGRAAEIANAAIRKSPVRASTPSPLPGDGDGEAVDAGRGAAEGHWARLFVRVDFFAAYRQYIAVELRAASEAELLHWRAFCRARLVKLVKALESTAAVDLAHPLPWPMRVPAARPEDGDEHDEVNAEPSPVCTFFIGFRVAKGAGERQADGSRHLDLRPAAATFVSLGDSWGGKAELCPSAQMQVRVTHRSQLPHALLDGGQDLPFADDHDDAGGDLIP